MRCKLFIFLQIIIFFGCEVEEFLPENSLDPSNPDYVAPGLTITSPEEGKILDSSIHTFNWQDTDTVSSFKENQGIEIEYRFKLDNKDWSSFGSETSVEIEYLDEGSHEFSVQSTYLNGETSTIEIVNFQVDAVAGPTLMVYPRRTIASVGETLELQIIAEEVINLTAVEYTISFDQTIISVESLTMGEFFQAQGESILHFELSTGKLSIIAALLGGESPSVTGTGTLINLEFRILKVGITTFDFNDLPILKNQDNSNITITETISGIIDVQ